MEKSQPKASRAKWVEPAFSLRSVKKDQTTLLVYPTPSERWNGMVFSGRLHVGDVVGGASVNEVKEAVSFRNYVISTVKEYSNISCLREELALLGLRAASH